MLIHNASRFVPTLFPARNVAGKDFWIFALKGTFRIAPDLPLTACDEQQPIISADVYWGAPNRSSLRQENDLAPHKPRSDITLEAVARAPGAVPARAWDVRVRVGELDKRLRVTGPRAWHKRGRDYELSEPVPTADVPMTFEHAWGGGFGDGEQAEVMEQNPLGTGFLPARARPTATTIRAPQIEDPNDPIGVLGASHVPQGLGPISRAWLPRRPLAGTFDDAWQTTRAPEWPLDHDEAFHNAAHPDLIYPGYLRGDEEVALEGLAAERLRFRLPGLRVTLFPAPALEVPRPVLDTLHLDVEARRAVLTWRTRFPAEPELDVLGVHVGPEREATRG